MSIYTKIYTLDKILRKVENNNTVILTDKEKAAVYSLQSFVPTTELSRSITVNGKEMC